LIAIKSNLKSTSMKILFISGLVMAFISLFLDWYYFKAYKSGALITDWSFNILLGWKTSFIVDINSNDTLGPVDSMEVFMMGMMFIIIIAICGFGVIMKDVEITNSIEKSKPYIYLNIFLIMLNGYFIAIMPCMFLFLNDLYFPFVIIEELKTEITRSYCIGPAYLMQLASFIAMFPHVLLSVLTMSRFIAEQGAPEVIMMKRLEESREEIPLDKFIAELDSESRSDKEIAFMYEKFQRQRRRRKK
jgi:hypothetical protein